MMILGVILRSPLAWARSDPHKGILPQDEIPHQGTKGVDGAMRAQRERQIDLIERARVASARIKSGANCDPGALADILDGLIAALPENEAVLALRAAERRERKLQSELDRAIGACRSAWQSIGRFPGSVHDRAMARLERVLFPGRHPDYPQLDPKLPAPEALEKLIADGLAALRPPAAIARNIANLIDGGTA